MSTLFEPDKPLAERMRPTKLDDCLGQEHLTGKNGVLRRILGSGTLPSMIFWGPPGVGKTTLAQLLCQSSKRPFYTLSAVSAGVKEVREIIEKATHQRGAVLFIDEIHRFNKSQQDALLSAVERGILTLIGATTENPSFEVNSALLSRCQIYTLNPLTDNHITTLLQKALSTDPQLCLRPYTLPDPIPIVRLSGGDARKALNLLEVAASLTPEPYQITEEIIQTAAQRHIPLYDKNGEAHYDIISAFIKSLRGSDPNAALYYLARMIEGGEDPKFIARRMLILASEDIGNANPTALALATSCFQAVTFVGYPEARIILAQTATYLACSPKSNASYVGIENALELVRKTGDLPVPLHLRNSPTPLMKKMGYGAGYQYVHDFQGNFVEQEYLPDAIAGTRLYEPLPTGREGDLRAYLRKCWKEKYGY